MLIKGLPGSPGCEVASAVIYSPKAPTYERIEIEDPETEISEMQVSRDKYKNYLSEVENNSGDDSGIFEAYRDILEDDAFFDDIKRMIREEKVCSSYAIEQKRIETEAIFMEIDDDYLRERVADINNVCNELCAHIQGISVTDPLGHAQGDSLVIFAHDLTPADTVRMDPSRVAGLVTEIGGTTSHTVILARARKIPAIVGTGDILEKVKDGDEVFIDGDEGICIINPDSEQREEFLRKKAGSDRRKEIYDACASKDAITKDGRRIKVNINSGDRESIEGLDPDSCDGCGLFRTEFLYMSQNSYPSEELQFEAYKEMAEKLGGKELIIRTLDIGGDKQLDYMDIPLEANPFLGFRAIRLCLERKDVFKTQLRAILRASVFGNVKIMFPMIVTLEELRAAKQITEEAKAELKAEGLAFNEDIQLGIMVETPAAAMISDKLAKEADFFSVGTNDLIQYTTACDRQNEKVQNIYDNCNISFIREMNMIAENAHAAGIEIGICGETASEARLIPLWIAMGIDELSVSTGMVGRTKYIISKLDASELRGILDEVLSASTIDEVKNYLDGIINEVMA